MSHNYAGTCNLCFRAADRLENKVATSIGAAREKLKRIAGALVAAGVEPRDRYVEGTTSKQVRAGLFWLDTKMIDIRDPSRDRYGWLLGSHPWLIESRTYDGETRNHQLTLATYLTKDGDLAAEGGRAGKIDDGMPYAYLRGDRELQFWETLVAEATDVAQRFGVHDLP
ncbi:hypothetical protein [Micromonospora sp. IBSANI012]|uniref:hypothetical protein n=1 Tax=Micromonospora sp. IBSANI012 TaxID=3457761 RepID=UPI00405884E1